MLFNITSLELNITNSCNFSCKYCIQPNVSKKFDIDLEYLDSFIRKVISRYKKDERLKITFWGGEPLLERNLVLDIIKKYETNNQVCFYMYTNGSLFDDDFLDYIDFINSKYGLWKFIPQISFDGIKVHSEYSNQIEKVLINIFKVENLNIDLRLKATLPIKMFRYLSDTVLSYMALNKLFRYKSKTNLSITVDYLNEINKISDEEFELHLEDLKREIVTLKKNFTLEELNFCNFFRSSRSTCSAGMNYFTVDIDGSMYPCHGALYVNCDDLYIGNIYDDNIFTKIEKYQKQMTEYIKNKFWQCQGCTTDLCYRCHVQNYIRNKDNDKLSFIQKWNSKNQDRICTIYRTISRLTKPYTTQDDVNKLYHIAKTLTDVSREIEKYKKNKARTLLHISKDIVDLCEEMLISKNEIEQIKDYKKLDVNSYIDKIRSLAGWHTIIRGRMTR